MDIRQVSLKNKVEIRNDGTEWVACRLPDGAGMMSGDTLTFHPSVDLTIANVDMRVVSCDAIRHVAGEPFVSDMDNNGLISILLHNRNGGVTRLDAGYIVGHVHVEAAAREQKRKTA